MSETYLVIMAGGSGTRFWPASRAALPKQLLTLDGGDETLLQCAVRRAAAVVGDERVLVVTSARHGETTRAQLPQLPERNILLEPVGRNTAPCIAWALAHVRRRHDTAVIGVLPADPYIGDEPAYLATLGEALRAAEGGAIVTIGVRPTRPETGYGYIELTAPATQGVQQVARFVEKPDRPRALEFLQGRRHLWNSGMFFFRADSMLEQLSRHLPELHAFVGDCNAAAERGDEPRFIEQRYQSLPAVSIDYGVMEKADDILTVVSDFGWDDIGSWGAAWALADKDRDDNATHGEALLLDSKGCYVSAPAGKLVALIGARDLIVVDTEDALLIVPRERSQDVREVVAALRESGRTDRL